MLTQSKHLQFRKTKNFTLDISSPKSSNGNIDFLQFNSLPTKIELADEIGSVSTKEDSQQRFDPEVGALIAAEKTSEPTTAMNRLFRVSRFNPNFNKEISYFDRQRDTLVLRSEQPPQQVKRKINFDRQSTSSEHNTRKKTKDFSLRSQQTAKQSVRHTTDTAKSVLKISGCDQRVVREHKSLESKIERIQGIINRYPHSEQKVTISNLSLKNSKPNQQNKTRVGFFLIKPQRTSDDKS